MKNGDSVVHMWFTDHILEKKHSTCLSMYIHIYLTNKHTRGALFFCTNKDIQTDRCQNIARSWKKMPEVSPDLPQREEKLPLCRICTVGTVLKFHQQPTQLPPWPSSPWCAVCPSYGVGSIDQANPMQETSSTRVNQALSLVFIWIHNLIE